MTFEFEISLDTVAGESTQRLADIAHRLVSAKCGTHIVVDNARKAILVHTHVKNVAEETRVTNKIIKAIGAEVRIHPPVAQCQIMVVE